MPPQTQAWGIASIGGHEFEAGYISIAELLKSNVELDLHFEPQKLGSIIQNRLKELKHG